MGEMAFVGNIVLVDLVFGVIEAWTRSVGGCIWQCHVDQGRLLNSPVKARLGWTWCLEIDFLASHVIYLIL